MNEDRIKELKSKRLKIQEEIRLKELKKRVESQISHLDKLGESYFVYYDFENLNWIDSNIRVRNRDGYNGMHGDFQIDIDDSTALLSFNLRSNEINSEKFNKHFSSIITEKLSLIICYQGGSPELEISTNAFLDNPIEYFSRPETWILTSDKKWVIEYIWEQNVIRFIQLQDSIPILIQKLVIADK